MKQSDPPRRVPLEQPELEYLINKKNEDIAGLRRALRFLIVFIFAGVLAVAMVMFIVFRFAQGTFIRPGEPAPNIPGITIRLIVLLLCIIFIATCYSYFKTVRKLVQDIRDGEKITEPCTVIRKLYSSTTNTCHVYITSVVRLSIEVTESEYAMLDEGDKVSIEYSPRSKIFFGYSIERPNR